MELLTTSDREPIFRTGLRIKPDYVAGRDGTNLIAGGQGQATCVSLGDRVLGR